MNERKPIKVYVSADVKFSEDGRMLPHVITWEDGHKYEIDKVTDIRPATAIRAGGQEDRYTIWIGRKRCVRRHCRSAEKYLRQVHPGTREIKEQRKNKKAGTIRVGKARNNIEM